MNDAIEKTESLLGEYTRTAERADRVGLPEQSLRCWSAVAGLRAKLAHYRALERNAPDADSLPLGVGR